MIPLSAAIPVLIYLCVGALVRRSEAMPENASLALNQFVLQVSLPAVVLHNIPKLEINTDLWVLIAIPWLMLLVSVGLVQLWTRVFGFAREVEAALMLLVPLGNTSFLGIPLIRSVLGEEAVVYALLYDQFGSFLGLSIYGALVVAWYGGSPDARPTMRSIGLKIVRFPPAIALAAALWIRDWTYPAMFAEIVEVLANTLVPVVMVAVGMQLSLRLPGEFRVPFVFGLGSKMILAPAVAAAFVLGFADSNLASTTAILEAAMPPMVSAGALAMASGFAPKLTAAMVGFGILCAFVSIPTWQAILSQF